MSPCDVLEVGMHLRNPGGGVGLEFTGQVRPGRVLCSTARAAKPRRAVGEVRDRTDGFL